MKLLITAAFCLCSLICVCQVSGESKNGQVGDISDLQKRSIRRMLSENPLLATKQGYITFLPQDRMPCLVPDTTAIKPIPNAWLGVQVPYKPQHHSIPNPSGSTLSFRYNVLDDGLPPSKK